MKIELGKSYVLRNGSTVKIKHHDLSDANLPWLTEHGWHYADGSFNSHGDHELDIVAEYKEEAAPAKQPVSDSEILVIKDIIARQQRGLAKYGTTVAENPLPLREWLQHQYEELLDAAIYCKRAMQEMDK